MRFTGQDALNIGRAILSRQSFQAGEPFPIINLLGLPVGFTIGTSVFGLTASGGFITGAVILTGGLVLLADGQGSVVTIGQKGGFVRMPYAGKFTAWTILADQSGSIVFDVWKRAFASFPPTVADTITAANKPTITAATNAEGTVNTWTTAFTADDVIAFNVDSCSSITQASLILKTERT